MDRRAIWQGRFKADLAGRATEDKNILKRDIKYVVVQHKTASTTRTSDRWRGQTTEKKRNAHCALAILVVFLVMPHTVKRYIEVFTLFSFAQWKEI
jgi:hypothetical protein